MNYLDRLRHAKNNPKDPPSLDDCWELDGVEFGRQRLAADEAEAARELLRLTDPTPIDEAWVVSLGATGGCKYDGDCEYDHPYNIGQLRIWNHNDPHDWCLSDFDDHIITTRGELRSLAKLLKIDLKEQA